MVSKGSAMEDKCPLCSVRRKEMTNRCECGYVYTTERSPPDGHDHTYEEGMPQYRVYGCFTLLLFLVITGGNGLGWCLFLIAGILAAVVGSLAEDGAWPWLVSFAVGAILVDGYARHIQRCSILDVKSASQFMMLPIWIWGIVALVIGMISVAVKYTAA
jgi:hypothetical protein